MADQFTPTKTVPDVRAATTVPIVQRHVTAQTESTPDFQSATNELAASENYLSAIGAKVAESASNMLATQLGGDLGKHPKGDLGIPFTEFDKNFQQSYSTQAHATLGLQADKLITDSNLHLSKASRLTPQLIAESQASISKGLKKIYDQAPSHIRPQLEATYGAAQLSQGEQLARRMLNEQHEDRRNNTIVANDKNAELAHSLAASGHFDTAMKLAETTANINDSAVAGNIGFTPQQAKVGADTVRQAAINGRLQYEYDQANAQKKGDEYLKNLATRPDWISDKDYPSAIQSIRSHVSNQEGLRANYEELTMSDFKTRIASDALSIPGTELQSTLDKLSPINAAKLNAYYEQQRRTQAQDGATQANLVAHYDDPAVQANASDKIKNGAFHNKVDYAMRMNPNLSADDAEVQVATLAGAKVPVFQKSLENKLTSANPVYIASAVHQIQLLDEAEAGRAYDGISQKAKAIAIQFQQQRGSMPDSDLARKITDNLSNIDDSMQKTLNNSWSLILSSKGAGGLGAGKSLVNFALQEVGLDSKHNSELGGSYFGTIYGNDIYNQLQSNFITTRGDYDAALQMTKDYVKAHYGETYVNGEKQISDSPVEKYLNHKGSDVTPFVQKDMLDQLDTSFTKSKKSHPNDYWETLPLTGATAEVVRTVKTKDGEKKYRYPVNLVGRAGNQWDVVVKTPYGNRNLFLVAPSIGVTTYQPNKEAIDEAYLAHKKEVDQGLIVTKLKEWMS